MASKYFDNPWIQHYLEELDKAIDQYIAARNRGDWPSVLAAAKKMDSMTAHIQTRTSKIVTGKGNSANRNGGWNPPDVAKMKNPPAAVRAEKE